MAEKICAYIGSRKKQLISLFLLFLTMHSYATHNRAGDITYQHISGYTFRITITTYTRIGSNVEADRDTLNIDWGQGGPNADIPRTIKEVVPNTNKTIQRNVYSREYTFSGPGRYSMVVVDPNRNQAILNIPNSVEKPFCIKSELRIDPWVGANSSVQFKNRAIEFICKGKPWFYNPGAYDLDGDSLAYRLVPSLGENGQPLPGYVLPHLVDNLGKTFEINPQTGDIFWDQPELNGEYNVGVLVEEFDRATGLKKGEVLRDIQITVDDCEGEPPVIYGAIDTCIEAGQVLNMKVWGVDPDKDSVLVSASGTPFDLSVSPATFTKCAVGSQEFSSCGVINWATTCSHIRKIPYVVYVMAIEDKNLGYSSIKRMNITVVGPAPKNPITVPKGNQMNLSWNKPDCANATGYRVYHRVDSLGFLPGHCEIGVPAYTGYKFIGQVKGLDNTSFVHNDVYHGQRMCYMVTAVYPDGVEGYASEEFCAYLVRDVPIITNVSVNVTDMTTGSDTLKWVNPTVLDTVVAFPGPYHYKIYQGQGYTDATNLVFTTPLSTTLWQTQTWFRQDGINTLDTAHVFKLELYSGNDLIGTSKANSSVFLSIEPGDNKLRLSWAANIGWINYQNIIFRKGPGETVFSPIDTVGETSFLDTGLTNSQTYCYYIKTVGKYSLEDMPSPLINFSQETCAIPYDLTPPCPPVLAVVPNCETTTNQLTWTINDSCAQDVEQYNIYRRETNLGPFTFVKTIVGKYNMELTHVLPNSIAGCYYVTAVDSVNSWGDRNESEPSNVVCVDNCPEYVLPNVFTPNGDKINDLYIPIKNKFIRSVEFIVFNRWGREVFRTTDPGLYWDGTIHDELLKYNNKGSDGVYYYVCRYDAITLEGIKSDKLNGFIHMFYDEKFKTD